MHAVAAPSRAAVFPLASKKAPTEFVASRFMTTGHDRSAVYAARVASTGICRIIGHRGHDSDDPYTHYDLCDLRMVRCSATFRRSAHGSLLTRPLEATGFEPTVGPA